MWCEWRWTRLCTCWTFPFFIMWYCCPTNPNPIIWKICYKYSSQNNNKLQCIFNCLCYAKALQLKWVTSLIQSYQTVHSPPSPTLSPLPSPDVSTPILNYLDLAIPRHESTSNPVKNREIITITSSCPALTYLVVKFVKLPSSSLSFDARDTSFSSI